jgi:hypothetical protein
MYVSRCLLLESGCRSPRHWRHVQHGLGKIQEAAHKLEMSVFTSVSLVCAQLYTFVELLEKQTVAAGIITYSVLVYLGNRLQHCVLCCL